MKYAITITPDDKEIELRTMESTNGNAEDSLFSMLSPITDVDGLSVYSLPVLDSRGWRSGRKFFLCTRDDIIEIEGMAVVPLPDKSAAQGLIDKLRNMVEWQKQSTQEPQKGHAE